MFEIWLAVVNCTHIKESFLVLNQSISDCNPHLPQDAQYTKLWVYYPHEYMGILLLCGKFEKTSNQRIQEGN